MNRARQACLLSGLLLSGAASAQIDTLIGGAVTPLTFSSRYALSAANAANLGFVSDPAGSGRTVLSTAVNGAEGEVGAIKRTDFHPLGEALATGVRWYGISVYVPNSWVVHPNPAVIAQIDSAATASGLGAPLSLLVRGGGLELNLVSNHLAAGATASNSAREIIKLGALVTNRWYCLVVRSDWQTTLGSGAITMWMNGEKVYNASNSTNSYFGAAQTPRAGLMFPGLMGVTERTLYTDFIRLGGPTTTALQMYQISPCSSFVNGSNIQW
ncbi:heparin lyase I family protein [Pseudoduganella namucuonensis]|uniref:Polysaccharide lyase n=1 Tax=Pseudoduganella namucuonensis TaxID=1035707 RepID=A0A1I7K0E3_9BURK|nr:heparin lyase I family protein [Pseudoduganella namucuonensis]SFU90903.1 Polysaccharide lyase [Pseudoduganella namucuonensis]